MKEDIGRLRILIPASRYQFLTSKYQILNIPEIIGTGLTLGRPSLVVRLKKKNLESGGVNMRDGHIIRFSVSICPSRGVVLIIIITKSRQDLTRSVLMFSLILRLQRFKCILLRFTPVPRLDGTVHLELGDL